MGTNYYAIPKISDKDVKRFDKMAEKRQWSKLNLELGKKHKEIHLGKSSAGWVFIFNHNNYEFYGIGRNRLNEFLKTCVIQDEYGNETSLSDFWAVVDDRGENPCVDGLVPCEDGLWTLNTTEFS